MDMPPMDTSLAQANALHRMLRQGLLAARSGPIVQRDADAGPPPADAAETMPMLYRSEAFADDLTEP